MAIKHSGATVSTTATLIVRGGDNHLPKQVAVQNTGAADIFLGSSAVTTTTGLKVSAGATSPTLMLGSGDDLYGICATGTVAYVLIGTLNA